MQSLVLDLGNVVAFFDHGRACRQIAALATNGATDADVFSQVFGSPLEADFDCGRFSTPEFVGAVRGLFAIDAPDEAIAEAWSDIFRPNEDVVAILPALKRSTAKLVLASNTNELHYHWLASRMTEPFECFDDLVLSFRIGMRKPAHGFFQQCVEAAGTEPRDCVYVDDREDFVEIAASLGLTAVRYQPEDGFASVLAGAGIRVD